MGKFIKLMSPVKSLTVWVFGDLDVRDFFVLGGLGMLFYGLYLLAPWIAFTVCGSLLILHGLISSLMVKK